MKKDEGHGSVRCSSVARDSKAGQKSRDDLYAEKPPLHATRALFAYVALAGPEETEDNLS